MSSSSILSFTKDSRLFDKVVLVTRVWASVVSLKGLMFGEEGLEDEVGG